jgi:hypothetical protein
LQQLLEQINLSKRHLLNRLLLKKMIYRFNV